MNKYLKEFLHRGLIFSGFGPIIAGIVYLCLSYANLQIVLNADQMFKIILSTYLLAFIHAGASVFNQIEEWPVTKSLFVHMLCLYVTYISCYLFNSWLPFSFNVIIIFTVIFLVTYLIIWGIVYMCIKACCEKMNRRIR